MDGFCVSNIMENSRVKLVFNDVVLQHNILQARVRRERALDSADSMVQSVDRHASFICEFKLSFFVFFFS